MPKTPSSPLNRLFLLYHQALTAAGGTCTPQQLERWVLSIHSAMSGRSRDFHGLDHIFEVSEGLEPLEKLAVIYHDLVYLQVDRGIPEPILARIGDRVEVVDGKVSVRDAEPDDLDFMVLRVFDFMPGVPLPLFGGANEFLSALVAVRDLGGVLPLDKLAVIACGIEGTIPFRGPDATGKTASQRLEARLSRIASEWEWNWSREQIEAAVRSSVAVGNADVANFGYESPARFLDNTWKLLPETNWELHTVGAYTVQKYRVALQKMEGFLSTLPAEVVFHEYLGKPSAKEMEGLKARTSRNLKTAVLYLRAKLLAISILEGLAETTGGDVPISFFAGPPSDGQVSVMQLQDLLPEPDTLRAPSFDGVDATVLALLVHGRTEASSFDTKSSPLAGYLYQVFGNAELERQVERAKQAFQEKLGWLDFLRGLPKPLNSLIAESAGEFAFTRRETLQRLARELAAG